MSYCTYSDIETRLGADDLADLADHDGDGTADAAVVAQAIEDAEALMDSYLGVRYVVPVELDGGGAPDSLQTGAVNIALYFLCLGRDSVTDAVRAQHDEDLDWLRRVAAGTVSLGVDEKAPESDAAPGVQIESRDRIFGRDEPL